ncbi:MAG: hypothetical protein Q9218_007444 [Villophora microphyllina]
MADFLVPPRSKATTASAPGRRSPTTKPTNPPTGQSQSTPPFASYQILATSQKPAEELGEMRDTRADPFCERAVTSGITVGSFGVVAATGLLFFFSDVPKVRTDIMQKLPIIGDHFVKEIPPEDNPF